MRNAPDLLTAVRQMTAHMTSEEVAAELPNPIIILSAPRSGSNMLFENLAQLNPFWTIGGESHGVFRAFPHLRAENEQLDSMALGKAHADPQTCDMLRRCFLALLKNNRGIPYLSLPQDRRPKNIFLLEKTPRNALNIPFLLEVFPAANFIYLHRDGKACVSSLMEAWELGMRTGRFVTFRDLPNWHLPGWCFLLPPGWRNLSEKPISEIARFQWTASNEAIMRDLTKLEKSRWTSLSYASLVQDPSQSFEVILQYFQIGNAGIFPKQLAPSRTTVSAPKIDKWKRHENEISPLIPHLSEMQLKIETFCG